MVTLGVLTEAVRHLASTLMRDYVDEVIPVHKGPAWTHCALDLVTTKGPHMSAYTPMMTSFICREMRQRVRYGYSILLPAVDTVRVFWENMNMPRFTAVSQEHCRMLLVLNL